MALVFSSLKKGGSLEDYVSVFKKIVADLETMEVKYDEEESGLILLCSLSPSYVTFRDTIFYSRDILTIDEVYVALYSKKMKHLVVDSKGLVIRERKMGGNGRGRVNDRNINKVC